MNYKFDITLPGNKDFFCEIAVDPDSTFKELNDFIIRLMRFDPSNISSFFAADDDGNRMEEIAAFEEAPAGDGILLMDNTVVRKVINARCMNLEYVYDRASQAFLKMEYAGGYMGEEKEEMPKCIEMKGKAPRQSNIRKIFKGVEDLDADMDHGNNRSRGKYEDDLYGGIDDLEDDFSGENDFSDGYPDDGGGRFENLDEYIDKM